LSGRATGSRRHPMEYFIAGLVSFAIGVYLLYALLKPEKF
jgi:K+-transporting ATPase KdpF subunit